MTHQVPPFRPPVTGAPRPAARPARAFIPVPLQASPSRRKRPHWAARALGIVGKALLLSFCVFVALVTLCVTYHHLTRWG